jgi:5-methylcytosine-specific restriction endonuclease McrA
MAAPRGFDHSLLYTLYLRSEAWRAKRLEVLARAGWTCERCGLTGVRLDVHHRHYRNLGDEPLEDLQALCRPCHEVADEERRQASDAALNATHDRK